MITFHKVSKVFPNGTAALKDVSLTIHNGEFVVIVGLSGAGKSTLLRSVNRLAEPTSGQVLVDGRDVTAASPRELRQIRREIGMIFQSFNLVKRSTVLKNVLAGRLGHTPTWRSLLGLFPQEDVERALTALDRVSIREKAYSRADEPVASLDPPTSHMVMRDLQRINHELGITTVVNLHFLDLARAYAQRIIGLRAGEVVFDGPAEQADDATFAAIYGRDITAEDLRERGGVS